MINSFPKKVIKCVVQHSAKQLK